MGRELGACMDLLFSRIRARTLEVLVEEGDRADEGEPEKVAAAANVGVVVVAPAEEARSLLLPPHNLAMISCVF